MESLSNVFIGAIVAAIVGGAFSLFSYLLYHYFSRIHTDIKELKKIMEKRDSELSELKGSFRLIHGELKQSVIESTKLRLEINAIWRYVDRKPRATDDEANGHEE